MNAVAVGIDLVDVARVERMIVRHGDRGLRRVLTSAERSYCLGRVRPEQHVAVRLAAKEAAYKALQNAGTARKVGWLEIEVVQDGDGRPGLRLHGRADAAFRRLGATQALLSLTHTSSSAGAVVVLVG